MALRCDAVFEGGGVKGIGLVGAAAAIEEAGYEFINLAGTSAGAIVASLLVVGYTAGEIGQLLQELRYKDFEDENWLDRFSVPGKIMSVVFRYGIYKGEFLENWLGALLEAKGKTTFGDIKLNNPPQVKYTYRFQAIASDMTDKRLLILPGDLKGFGYDPDQVSIAAAVRMSISIPLFFEPVRLTDSQGKMHYIVDGGVLSNYPIWLLDDGTSDPSWPTFGFKLVDTTGRTLPQLDPDPIHNIADYLGSLLGTMIGGNDNYHIAVSSGDYDRSICIPTTVQVGDQKKIISTVDFDITPEESMALFDNGLKAGKAFLQGWDFDAWKKKYREHS
jgi:NTE family protein